MSRNLNPARYVAKYASKQGGGLHFGGTIGVVNFSEVVASRLPYGRKVVAESVQVQYGFFHMRDKRIRRKR
jgi:hypothetical protein